MDKEDFQKHDIKISIGAKIILEKYIVDSKKINEDADIPNILTVNNYVKRTFNVYSDSTLRKKIIKSIAFLLKACLSLI